MRAGPASNSLAQRANNCKKLTRTEIECAHAKERGCLASDNSAIIILQSGRDSEMTHSNNNKSAPSSPSKACHKDNETK